MHSIPDNWNVKEECVRFICIHDKPCMLIEHTEYHIYSVLYSSNLILLFKQYLSLSLIELESIHPDLKYVPRTRYVF